MMAVKTCVESGKRLVFRGLNLNLTSWLKFEWLRYESWVYILAFLTSKFDPNYHRYRTFHLLTLQSNDYKLQLPNKPPPKLNITGYKIDATFFFHSCFYVFMFLDEN